MTTAQTQLGDGRTRVFVATSVMPSFISFRRTLRLYSAASAPQHFTSAWSRNQPSYLRRSGSPIWFLALCFWLALAAFVELRAQQTIFNVPSSDVLDKGKVYAELDVPFKTNDDPRNVVPRFSSFVPRVVIGTGNGVELGLNVSGNVNPGPDSTTLVPAIKWRAYEGETNGWAIVLGDNVFVPARNRSYAVGNYVYGQASKTFTTATRVTFGIYHFSNNVVAPDAQRAGAQFGFEQPITARLGLAADWFTGKHAAGYLTPGLIFKPSSRVTGYVGYSLGNSNLTNGNHYFLLELGFNFN